MAQITESELEETVRFLQISPEQQEIVSGYLYILKVKHPVHFEHSMRVGQYSNKLAPLFGLEQKPGWYGGNLHDIGKISVPREVLNKKEINDQDRRIIRRHPWIGYLLLQDVLPFTAEIALRHHTFQPKGYPVRLPKPKFDEIKTKLITDYARVVSIADFYDALTTRKDNADNRYDRSKSPRTILTEHFNNHAEPIERAFQEGIFHA